MKVLMINSVCGIGSTGRICTDLAKILEEQKIDVKIAYGRGIVPQNCQKYSIKIGSNIDLVFHLIKSRLFDNSGFNSKNSTLKFIKWIKEYDPDIIHLHNIHGYYLNIEYLFEYFKQSKKKIIWTLHDCWAFTGHAAHCDVYGVKCFNWKTGCHNCPLKNTYPKSLIDKSENNWQKKKQAFTELENLTLISPSKWLYDLLNESYLKEYDCKIINNGIDINSFKHKQSDFKQKHNLENKIIILGVASVWTNDKGYKDFIELSQKLNDNYKIVMVGLNDKQLKDIPKNILGIKRTNTLNELVNIYNGSDVFLNLTYSDNYPTVNLEARACGLPIITYNTGGSPESAGINSIVVEKGNLNECVNIIKNKKYSYIQEDCSLFDAKKCLSKYIDLYKEII